MITTLGQLNHSTTTVTALPTLLFAQIKDSLRSIIVVTITASMPAQIAFFADFGLAFFAETHAPSRCSIQLHVLWLYPLTTSFGGTVQPVFCGVFGELAVP
jgi:hypothetical protein